MNIRCGCPLREDEAGAGGSDRMRLLLKPGVRSLAILALLAIIHAAASGDTLQGRVVGITDGDTLTVLAAGHPFKVRLAGIDAPERRQRFGHAARQALAAATFDKSVVVLFHKRDRYGRLVGKVLVDGKDSSLALLEAGLAWHYLAFAREQEPRDREAYAYAEQHARRDRRGLWAQPTPQPPWQFRLARRGR
jgi:endonuclease YncB( thermonuclease family)